MDNSEAPIQRWWNEETVAVVTGANKGIGYAVVRQLADHGIRVILTARDEERGKAAAKSLNDEGFHKVDFHQLDVQNGISVQAFANWLKAHYGKLDILVNNAAISGLTIDYDILKANKPIRRNYFKVDGITETFEMAKECIEINYYGTKRIVEALLPLLKLASEGGGRIVNVSSRAGVLEFIPNENLRRQLNNLDDFLKDFQQGMLKAEGLPVTYSAYFISKAALNAYTRILALQHPDINVNCVHPGFVNTDININVGALSIDEGAKGPVMLALLPPGSLSGQYYDLTEISSFYVLLKKDSP